MSVSNTKGLATLDSDEVEEHPSHLVTLGRFEVENASHFLDSEAVSASLVLTPDSHVVRAIGRTRLGRQLHAPTPDRIGECLHVRDSDNRLDHHRTACAGGIRALRLGLDMNAVKRVGLLAISLAASAALSAAQQTGGYGVPSGSSAGAGATPFAGAPTGTCSSTQTAVDTTTGNYYSCNNGAWQKVGPAAGGPPTGTASGSLAGNYPNPSLAAQAANTLLGNNTGSSAAPAALTVSQVAVLLSLGTAASQPTSAFDASGAASAARAASLQESNNLSDLASAVTARANLGLGSAATQPSSAFDSAGAASSAQAASLQKTSNLSDLASSSAARTNLGLGTAATQASTTFDASGAAATAQANAIAASAPSACANGSYACSASPAFTGTPTAPTQAISTNNTDIATTAAVTSAIAGLSSGGSGTVSAQAAGVIPLATAATAVGAQSHLDDGNTTSGQLTSTEPLNIANASAVNSTSYAGTLNSIISGASGAAGSCALSTTWYTPITAAVNGCISAPAPGTGPPAIAGGIFTAYSQDNRQSYNLEPIGVLATGVALVNGAVVYGANMSAEDVPTVTSGVVLVGQENDLAPSSTSGPSAYAAGVGFRSSIGYSNGHAGRYPFEGFELSGSGSGAYWRYGLVVDAGALGTDSVVLNVGAVATATSSANSNCPPLLNIYEAFWNGSASANETWAMTCTINSGTTPNDYFKITNAGGASGATHYFDLTGGINLELDGSTSGSTYLSASATGGTLNLGSTNATVTAAGALTVASCTGCGSGYATSGANSNITSLTGLTTPLTVAQGGIGTTTSAANTVFGNFTGGTAAPGFSAAPAFSAAALTNFPTLNQNTTGSAGTVPWTGVTGGGANTVTTATSTAAPWTFSAPGAALTPTALFSGSWYTGGSSTTNWGAVTIAPAGNTFTGLSTAGTALLIGNPNGGTGNALDIHSYNGPSIFNIAGATGATAIGSTLTVSGVTTINANATIAGVLTGNNTINVNTNTAATASTCAVPNPLQLIGHYWTGSASGTNTMALASTCTPGTNGAETLTVSNSGSTGQFTFAVNGNESVTGTRTATNETVTSLTSAGIVTNTSGGVLGTSASLPNGVTNGISAIVASATGGSGTGTITCSIATCTNLRGTYTVAGGTFTTGSILTLAWPTTTTAYACISNVINGNTGASIGTNNIATATGIAFTSLTSAAGLTVQIEYQCQP